MWIHFDEDEEKILMLLLAGAAPDRPAEEFIAARGALHKRISEFLVEQRDPEMESYRNAVDVSDELEVDDGAVVSLSADKGAFVMSWSWISDDEAGVDSFSDEEYVRCAKRHGVVFIKDLAGGWHTQEPGEVEMDLQAHDTEADAAREWCSASGEEPEGNDLDDNQPQIFAMGEASP